MDSQMHSLEEMENKLDFLKRKLKEKKARRKRKGKKKK